MRNASEMIKGQKDGVCVTTVETSKAICGDRLCDDEGGVDMVVVRGMAAGARQNGSGTLLMIFTAEAL